MESQERVNIEETQKQQPLLTRLRNSADTLRGVWEKEKMLIRVKSRELLCSHCQPSKGQIFTHLIAMRSIVIGH